MKNEYFHGKCILCSILRDTEVVKAILLQVIYRFLNIKKIDSKTLCFESLSSVKLIAFWSLCGE